MKTPSSSSGSTVQAPRQSPARRRRERLLHPPGAQVQQVEEVGRQQQQGEIRDVVDPLPAEARGRVRGQRQRADRLDRPGREPAREHRPGVAAPAARGVGRAAAPERVVEQAEQRDPEHVDDPAAQLGVEQVEVGAVVEHRERRQRDQRAGDQRRAGRERDPPAGVVFAREAGAEHVGKPRAEREHGHRRRHDQAGEHQRRWAVPGPAGASRSGSRASAVSLTPNSPSAPPSA